MKVLYVSDYRNCRNIRGKRINFFRQVKRSLYGHPVSGQDGFFFASLCAGCDVKSCDFEWLKQHAQYVDQAYDVVLINYRIGYNDNVLQKESLSFFKHIMTTKGLVVTNAEAGILPENDLLDLFDVVFKREHYVDLDRYQISEPNKLKIRNTMICCPLINVTTKNVRSIVPRELGYKSPSDEYEYDLFFAGKTTHPSRLASLLRLSGEGFNLAGGLTPNKRYCDPIPSELTAQRVSMRRFAQIMRCSKINLAIEGKGEYTFRHNEALFLCTFMISSPSIRGLQLPLPLVEGTHYVCFDDLDDLVDKVRYYLNNDSERMRISMSGRAVFEREYDFKKHGEYIKKSLLGQNTD